MSRRDERVRYHLDPKGIRRLPEEDIRAILHGADDLIMSGGRSLLVKILRGSRAKEVVDLDLDKSPVHGYYKDLSEEEVLARIDWVIVHGYLAIEYDGRLPLLKYTPEGWEIEKETYADELLRGFDEMLATSRPPFMMSYLKDRNRGLIWRLLEKVYDTQDPKYIPLLEDWEKIDYRKVQERIRWVIDRLAGAPSS